MCLQLILLIHFTKWLRSMEECSQWIWTTQLPIVLQLKAKVSLSLLHTHTHPHTHTPNPSPPTHKYVHMCTCKHTHIHTSSMNACIDASLHQRFSWLNNRVNKKICQGSSIRQQSFMEKLSITLGSWIVAHKRSSFLCSQSKAYIHPLAASLSSLPLLFCFPLCSWQFLLPYVFS